LRRTLRRTSQALSRSLAGMASSRVSRLKIENSGTRRESELASDRSILRSLRRSPTGRIIVTPPVGRSIMDITLPGRDMPGIALAG
jgi:hypothetical protein